MAGWRERGGERRSCAFKGSRISCRRSMGLLSSIFDKQMQVDACSADCRPGPEPWAHFAACCRVSHRSPAQHPPSFAPLPESADGWMRGAGFSWSG